MKKFIAQSFRDWESLDNSNDPALLGTLRRNRERYGVSTRSQLTHALNGLWIIPGIYVAVKAAEIAADAGAAGWLVWLVAVIYAIARFAKSLADTDPVEVAKRESVPALPSAVVPKAKLIVDEEGKVYDLEGNHVTTLS